MSPQQHMTHGVSFGWITTCINMIRGTILVHPEIKQRNDIKGIK